MNKREERENQVSNSVKFLIINGVKYIYAHNWSGFDSILLLKYIEPHFNTDPVFFDGKILQLSSMIRELSFIKIPAPLPQ
jgi:hypothetical protein